MAAMGVRVRGYLEKRVMDPRLFLEYGTEFRNESGVGPTEALWYASRAICCYASDTLLLLGFGTWVVDRIAWFFHYSLGLNRSGELPLLGVEERILPSKELRLVQRQFAKSAKKKVMALVETIYLVAYSGGQGVQLIYDFMQRLLQSDHSVISGHKWCYMATEFS